MKTALGKDTCVSSATANSMTSKGAKQNEAPQGKRKAKEQKSKEDLMGE
jgi:hypothetical protein